MVFYRWCVLVAITMTWRFPCSWPALWFGFVDRFYRKSNNETDGNQTYDNQTLSNVIAPVTLNESNETIRADVAASMRFHDQVEIAHKGMVAVDKQFAAERFEHERLSIQLKGERLLISHLAAQHHRIVCEVMGMLEAIDSPLAVRARYQDGCGNISDGFLEQSVPNGFRRTAKQYMSQLARQAHISALLAVADEELVMLNNTEATELRRECASRDREESRLNDQVPKEREHLKVKILKETHAQLEQHPGLTEDGHFNLTALRMAGARHAIKWWVHSGWERLRLEFANDWRAAIRAMYVRRQRTCAAFVNRHRKHTPRARALEHYVASRVRTLNSTLHGTFGISLDIVGHHASSVADQGVQVVTEVAVVFSQLLVQTGLARGIAGILFASLRWCVAATRFFYRGLEAAWGTATTMIESTPRFYPSVRENPTIALVVALFTPLALALLIKVILLPIIAFLGHIAIDIKRLFGLIVGMARLREKALQNELAIVRSQLAVREEKLTAAAREIAAAKEASRESSAAHVAKLSALRDDIAKLAQRLVDREREFAGDMASVRQQLGEATAELGRAKADALDAAASAFRAKDDEAAAARLEVEAARQSEAAASKALEKAREDNNSLVARSNSLQRTLESLKHDLGRVTRESDKQRCATQRLRMTLTEAIDDRDRALAAKEEWREVASFPSTVDKIDKASAKENELRRIISKLTFSLQEKDMQLDTQRATAKALQQELSSSKRA
ncbi:hypothetical protein CTAYLR_003383 [Chrysophaeum taylorii]|uniref:Uncharacterized protein n=1 Tax=Chrysophaeum taylorii TaxID=2483200 RepID=A0AAD7UH72_9STRA|nr:hypothetical protein CTAYLR_003383 [Chrysophaeum taylorii]